MSDELNPNKEEKASGDTENEGTLSDGTPPVNPENKKIPQEEREETQSAENKDPDAE